MHLTTRDLKVWSSWHIPRCMHSPCSNARRKSTHGGNGNDTWYSRWDDRRVVKKLLVPSRASPREKRDAWPGNRPPAIFSRHPFLAVKRKRVYGEWGRSRCVFGLPPCSFHFVSVPLEQTTRTTTTTKTENKVEEEDEVD